jgi:protein SCO1/2
MSAARTDSLSPRPPRGGGHSAPGREVANHPAVWRTTIAAALVCAAGLALAHAATDGFHAYTLESARRLAALRSPVAVPDLGLDLADGGSSGLSALPGRVLLVDFVYASCPTYCLALGSIYARLQQQLAPEIAAGDVRLVTVTFDPARDGPGELQAYRARHSPDRAGWDLGRPARQDETRTWLKAFGVVVIPDGLGGYAHNAAVHVVGPDRKLVAILGVEDLELIVKTARDTARGSGVHVAAR